MIHTVYYSSCESIIMLYLFYYKTMINLHMSRDMRFPTMWFVRLAEPQISLHIGTVCSEPLLVGWMFYEC